MKSSHKARLVVYTCILFLANICYAQQTKVSKNLLGNQEWGYLPNKGQLTDQQGNVLSDIKYYGHQGSVYMYCRPGKLSFVFDKEIKEQGPVSEAKGNNLIVNDPLINNSSANISSCRADMVLLNANLQAKIIASGQQDYYENYYLAQLPRQGITNVRRYNTLTYVDIYPNIDLVLHSKARGLKYEFVLRPGGKVSDIQIQWYGLHKAVSLAQGGITYNIQLGNIAIVMKETAPISFTSLGKLESHFEKNGNKISFAVGAYDHKQTLTIDPELNWGTYLGGNGLENSGKIKSDAKSNVYVSGFTRSLNGIASSGAYRTSNAGDLDAFLGKFDYNGHPKWVTYFGGTGIDYGYSLSLDSTGNIFMTGLTYSSGLASSGASQTSYKNNGDGFLAKFSNNGSLVWSTYFGGNFYDIASEIACDPAGNVCIIGTTNSTSGIATSGAYKTIAAQYYHAFIAKFKSSGQLAWATYFGGENSATYGYATDMDADGNIYLTGHTASPEIATSGAYQSSVAGSFDGFLAKFSSSGSLLWGTYFGGKEYDICNGLCVDGSGNVYITGQTQSSDLATNGVYQTSFGGIYDAFLAKFSSSGALSWSTYFGGDQNEQATGMCIDKNNNIYITGSTAGLTGIASAGAYQTINGGLNDAYIARFNSSGKLLWSSYYGGEGQDLGTGIATDARGDILLIGYTASATNIVSPGAFDSKRDDSTKMDAFIVKISYPFQNDAGVDVLKHPNLKSCVDTESVIVRLKNYGTKPLTKTKIGWAINAVAQNNYQWTGNLAPGDTTSVFLASHYFPQGPYAITSYTSMPNGIIDSMNINDTLHGRFVSYPNPDARWIITHTGANYYFHVKDSSLASNYYTWILGDGFHTSGYGFKHQFPSIDTFDIKLIISNTFGCVQIHDTMMYVSKAGISKTATEGLYNINIYPNPFKDKTIIHFNSSQAVMVKVNITDMLGKEIYSPESSKCIAGDDEIEINNADSGLAAGTYIVHISINNEAITKKIVVLQ